MTMSTNSRMLDEPTDGEDHDEGLVDVSLVESITTITAKPTTTTTVIKDTEDTCNDHDDDDDDDDDEHPLSLVSTESSVSASSTASPSSSPSPYTTAASHRPDDKRRSSTSTSSTASMGLSNSVAKLFTRMGTSSSFSLRTMDHLGSILASNLESEKVVVPTGPNSASPARTIHGRRDSGNDGNYNYPSSSNSNGSNDDGTARYVDSHSSHRTGRRRSSLVMMEHIFDSMVKEQIEVSTGKDDYDEIGSVMSGLSEFVGDNSLRSSQKHDHQQVVLNNSFRHQLALNSSVMNQQTTEQPDRSGVFDMSESTSGLGGQRIDEEGHDDDDDDDDDDADCDGGSDRDGHNPEEGEEEVTFIHDDFYRPISDKDDNYDRGDVFGGKENRSLFDPRCSAPSTTHATTDQNTTQGGDAMVDVML